jgi:hypothetical protein
MIRWAYIKKTLKQRGLKMSNSINPVNPMMSPDLVDAQDYVQTGEVIILCEEFMRAVLDDMVAQGRGQDLAREMTQDEASEMQYLDYLIGTMPTGNDKEIAESEMIGIVICDIFAGIAGRVELDDDKVARHIPPAMANEDTALYLEKYEMFALASYVRHAIP